MDSMLVLTRSRSRALDREAERLLGIPSLLLMENAGAAVARETRCALAADESLRCVLILCGPGNNGGDGYSAARRLLDGVLRVEVLEWPGLSGATESDAARNRGIFLRSGGDVFPIGSLQDVVDRLEGRSTLVVDALFGTGLSRPLDPPLQDLVRAVNASGQPVLSVDVPTGLDADTGSILGACIRARATVSFAAPKRGLLLHEGPAHAGRIVVADLGLPPLFVARYLEDLPPAEDSRESQP